MTAWFKTKKEKILGGLGQPDASPKGSVDESIRPLIKDINALDGFVTTSSCAGRLAVYLEGPSKVTAASPYGNVGRVDTNFEPDPESANAMHARRASTFGVTKSRTVVQKGSSSTIESTGEITDLGIRSAGGKGGGKWLFTSHEPLDMSNVQSTGSLLELFGMSKNVQIATPSTGPDARFVHFKFEPMILHILSSSTAAAQHAFSAGLTAGFRESGCSSILETSTGPPSPLVAIRSAGLSFDCIIAYLSPTSGEIQPMVSEEYMRILVGIANERFVVNAQRRERFRTSLLDPESRYMQFVKRQQLSKRSFAREDYDTGVRRVDTTPQGSKSAPDAELKRQARSQQQSSCRGGLYRSSGSDGIAEDEEYGTGLMLS